MKIRYCLQSGYLHYISGDDSDMADILTDICHKNRLPYITCPAGDWAMEFVDAVYHQSLECMREKYHGQASLFITHFEQFSGKEASQAELNYIIAQRCDAKRPTILFSKPLSGFIFTDYFVALDRRSQPLEIAEIKRFLYQQLSLHS